MRVDRRTLFRGLGAGAALAAFRADALARVGEAAKAAAGKTPAALASDEAYWFEIAQAFDVDRTLINLNNGGCSPAPAHVLNAMIQDLRFSNEIPVYHMWTVLEPRIESCRRELAAEFGCDPEEMAITRNASESLETLIFGIDLKPGDEVIYTNQNYPAHDHVLGAARPARRHRREADQLPRSPEVAGRDRGALPRRDHAEDPRHRGHPHHQPDRPDPPRARHRAARHASTGSRSSSTAPTPSRTFRSRATSSSATTTRRASTSGSSPRSARASSTSARTRSRASGR